MRIERALDEDELHKGIPVFFLEVEDLPEVKSCPGFYLIRPVDT